MTKLKLALAAALLGSSAAQAATFQFTYRADAGTVSGRLTGTLQSDNNTVLVDGVRDFVTLDGVALPSFPFVTTGSSIYGTPRAASVTFDGSNLDFLACTADEFCSDQGIGFDPDTLAFTPVFRIFVGAVSPDLIEEATDATRWTLSAVPEPATWGLMLVGFVAIGAVNRRRTASVAA
ncbi:PEPxxWA-CTERM sorting domain-containing protein [Sphingosinicellaceae bacterium]|nr:PEPxxWA-CTERM sorting domain-containing protein [Sphingosinicellaceae bacterium]